MRGHPHEPYWQRAISLGDVLTRHFQRSFIRNDALKINCPSNAALGPPPVGVAANERITDESSTEGRSVYELNVSSPAR